MGFFLEKNLNQICSDSGLNQTKFLLGKKPSGVDW